MGEFYNIEGFGNYLLSKGEGENDWSVWRIKKSGELKKVEGCLDRSGHIRYTLCSDNGKHVTKSLHQLIAEQFIPIPKELLESGDKLDVHHINENKLDNSISNLCWLTHSEHLRLHMKGKPRLEETKRKISDSMSKKEVFQYTLDGELVKIWESTCECGRNGFDKSHVAKCCRGKRKQCKGYIWSYQLL